MPEPEEASNHEQSTAYVSREMPHGDSIWQRVRSSKLLKIGLPLLLVALLPVVVFLSQQRQDDRSKASAASILYFSPTTSTQSPTVVTEGSPAEFGIIIDPGSNLVSFVSLVIEYDSTYITLENNTGFQANTTTFPGSPQPVYSAGKVAQTLQLPQGSTTPIQKPMEIARIRFKAVKATEEGKPVMIRFGADTKVTSIGEKDTFSENVLSSIRPAFVQVKSSSTGVVSTSITPVVTGGTSVTPAPVCTPTTADLNKDGRVDNADHTMIANCYKKGTTLAGCSTADINKDGSIDILDLNCVLRGGI